MDMRSIRLDTVGSMIDVLARWTFKADMRDSRRSLRLPATQLQHSDAGADPPSVSNASFLIFSASSLNIEGALLPRRI